MSNISILFVIKRENDLNSNPKSGLTNGLYTSAFFINEMLRKNGINSTLITIKKEGQIYNKIKKHSPTHVIIEALWLHPVTLSYLTKEYPNIKWIVRIHSQIPFLSTETNSFDSLFDYLSNDNVYIATNSKISYTEFKEILKLKYGYNHLNKIIYLPNYYPLSFKYKYFDKNKDTIDIGCYGAIRPLKNNLLQAIGAIKFANKIGKKLRFHINGDTLEMQGEPVFENLVSLFSNIYKSGHQLINDEWSTRKRFLNTCQKIDIGLQVSLSETFNIVSADFISQGVPIVGSSEIPWIGGIFAANSTSSDSIYKKLLFTYKYPLINFLANIIFLNIYIYKSRKVWLKNFKK